MGGSGGKGRAGEGRLVGVSLLIEALNWWSGGCTSSGLGEAIGLFMQVFDVELLILLVMMLVSKRAAADATGVFILLHEQPDITPQNTKNLVGWMRSWPVPVCRSGRVTDDPVSGPTFPEASSGSRRPAPDIVTRLSTRTSYGRASLRFWESRCSFFPPIIWLVRRRSQALLR